MSETLGVIETANTSYSPAGSPRKWSKKSLKVNGDWYSAFINPDNKASLDAAVEGASVRISYDVKGDFRNIKSISVVEGTKGEAATISNVAPNSKELRITFLASRRDAIEFVKSGLQLDLLSLGTKKADKMDIFYDLVNKYAARMTADAWHSDEIDLSAEAAYTEEAKVANGTE